jgi:hypothetical protein
MANAFTELASGVKGITALPGEAYRLAQNLANPNVNYLGVANPGITAANTSLANSQQALATAQAQVKPRADTIDPNPYVGDGGAGAASDAQERAATLFGIDTGINQANDALGRLDSQAQTGYGNISREYQDAYNRLMSGKTAAQDQYQRGVVDQTNNYLAKRNQNNQQAANWLMGAQRTLGVQGAGGGSAARYALPYEAQTQAAQQNSGAQATNNQNIGALTANWNKADTDFRNSEGDLQRQRDQGTNDYASKIAQQRADLLNNLGQLQGQRTIANGGDFRAAQAAANPYTSRISALLSQIDGLAATPAIREQQVSVGRPDLSQYNFARPEAAPAPLQDVSIGGGVAPIYADQQEQPNPLLALFGLGQDQRQLV